MYALDNVYNAIMLNKILYALPVYFGYLTEAHKDMLRQVLKRAKRIGFASYVYDLDQLNDIFQDKLFRQLPVWTTLSSPSQSVMGLRYSYEPQKVPSVARWSRSSVGHSLWCRLLQHTTQTAL